jgi:CheY-like chemotaxis protein/phosphoribosyl 1,2-cyclic phosphodiesterase
VEVRASDGTLVILDCGTGAYSLGRELLATQPAPIHGHLLVGHTHWDHIQGFPFFAPLFVPGNVWELYAPGGRGQQLEASLAGQMAYEYFPITLDALLAEVRLHDLTEGVFNLGSIRVTAQYLNHPALTLGYRLEVDGVTLVYATDYEPHSLLPLEARPGTTPIHHGDRRHVRFLEGADLVIHDAQYTLSDFPAKAGWGHTPMERAVDYALLGQVKRLALFHHDPDRNDEAVDQLCERARTRAAASDTDLEIFAAAEGQIIELAQGTPRPRPSLIPEASALLSQAPTEPHTVMIVDDDPVMVHLIQASLRAEGVNILTTTDGEAALRLARQEHPSLILLDIILPGIDGLSVCQELRAETDPRLCDVPIVMLTGEKLQEMDLATAFAAGVTDYLTKPIKPTLLRARVRTWLMRTSTAYVKS